MTPVVIAPLLVVAAYLIGAIPFGFLLAKWFKGIDIRTVGSGNIGATNVGRVLGFWFFWPVFLFDVAKGFLPTWGFPTLAARLTGQPAPPELAVLVALATILGHNFPVYLKFKGGKGVATSLGAVFALDPVAGAGAAIGFVVFLLVTRYVSLSSLGGGVLFALVHFKTIEAPWSREERAMTIITVGLLTLLIARHRKNLMRIREGTEPKVSLRKKREKSPQGCIKTSLLVSLAILATIGAGAASYLLKASRRDVLTLGHHTLTEVAREATGYQRAERVAFADGGRLLAVTCPRYNQLVLYHVTDQDALEPFRDLALEGKPVAVCTAGDRLYVLERPAGDQRHVEPGWWETFNLRGETIGARVLVGFYPDDMALSPDGRHALILTSGRAEGDARKPSPALDVYEIGTNSKSIGRVTFDNPRDDPSRITLSKTGHCAVVTLQGSNEGAAIDLDDLARPLLIGRSGFAAIGHPYPSRSQDDLIVMPTGTERESLVVSLGKEGDCIVSTLPRDSGLELFGNDQHQALGRLKLRSGTFNLGTTRPIGLAYSCERGLIAVANRSGGIHLVAIRPIVEQVARLEDD